MPLNATVSDFWVCTLGINGAVGGLTEVYHLPGTEANISDTRTNFTRILTARAKLLAKNHSIVKHSISLKSRQRDAYPPLTYQTGPELIGTEMDAPEVCSDTSLGLLYRFSTGDGKYVNRLVRGVRDSWITDNASTLAAFTTYAIGGSYLAYSAPNTAVDLVGNFLALVRDLTRLYVPTDPLASLGWNEYTFASVMYLRIGRRDLGKRLGLSRGRQASMS